MTMTVDRPAWADDGILADRVRSELGPVVKHLDQPRVHVMTVDGVVSLHGDVSDAYARSEIERAARRVRGVSRVDSHLRVGLRPGDCSPSAGRRGARSPLLQSLESAVRECGFLTESEERFVLRGALGVFAARLPAPLRRRVLEHLPGDVRRLAASAHGLAGAAPAIGTEHDLVQIVAIATMLDRPTVERLLHRVLPLLRTHVPGDADAVAEALPQRLRTMWTADPVVPAAPAPQVVRSAPLAEGLLERPVSSVMTRRLVTVHEDGTVFDAFELMSHTGVHHLPVVRSDGHCIAMLDAVSVAQHLPEAWVSSSPPPLHRAGVVGPLAVLPDEPLGKVARLMHAAGVDACCIVDVHGRLVGLLTARDLIALLAREAGDA